MQLCSSATFPNRVLPVPGIVTEVFCSSFEKDEVTAISGYPVAANVRYTCGGFDEMSDGRMQVLTSIYSCECMSITAGSD